MLPSQSSILVAVGSNIYKIGGADSYGFQMFASSSFVSFLDCRSHMWHQTRSMGMDTSSSSTASLVDGKIYVAGGNEDGRSSNWVEVFDPKSQTWDSVANPRMQLYDEFQYRRVAKSVSLEGKLYLFGDEFKVYNPKEGKWNYIEEDRSRMHHAVARVNSYSCYCVIDDVLFDWYDGVFKWYDIKLNLCKKLYGLEGLPDFRDNKYCKMVDLGGKMVVLWDVPDYTARQENRIWCAEISLEKRDGGEIWGKVEWLDFVLRVHVSCTLSHTDVLSASL